MLIKTRPNCLHNGAITHSPKNGAFTLCFLSIQILFIISFFISRIYSEFETLKKLMAAAVNIYKLNDTTFSLKGRKTTGLRLKICFWKSK